MAAGLLSGRLVICGPQVRASSEALGLSLHSLSLLVIRRKCMNISELCRFDMTEMIFEEVETPFYQ